MNVAEKISAFEQIAVQEAENKKRAVAFELDGKFTSVVDDALRDEEHASRERVQTERYKYERSGNKEVVNASSVNKRRVIEMRERLTAGLFENVEKDLREFAASQGYADFLLEKIKAASASGQYEAVQLTSNDMKWADRVARETNLTVEEARDDFIGGFRLITIGRRAVSEHTLLGQLAEQRAGFSMLAKKEGN